MVARRWAVVLLAGLAWGAARAEAVPDGIREWLLTTEAKVVMLHEGELWVWFRTPVVDEGLFRMQVTGLCSARTLSKRYTWGDARVERITLVNEAGSQGLALVGGEQACRAMDGMSEAELGRYLPGVTREVRAGRVTG
jgi:hypothetical protein